MNIFRRKTKTQLKFIVLSAPVVYRKPKYSAEAEDFHYLAFGFGRRSFILNVQPSVLY
jgi:hypothetical protein